MYISLLFVRTKQAMLNLNCFNSRQMTFTERQRTYSQIEMSQSIFCPVILMSVNVARDKSKPFSHLPLPIIWPLPLKWTPPTHTRCLLYNKAITIKAVIAGVLSITAEKLHLTHPA